VKYDPSHMFACSLRSMRPSKLLTSWRLKGSLCWASHETRRASSMTGSSRSAETWRWDQTVHFILSYFCCPPGSMIIPCLCGHVKLKGPIYLKHPAGFTNAKLASQKRFCNLRSELWSFFICMFAQPNVG